MQKPIDPHTFDFEAFFKKYDIKPAEQTNALNESEKIINYLIHVFNKNRKYDWVHIAYQLVETLIKQRCEELEPYILEGHLTSAKYAINILKQRWPEFEKKYPKRPLFMMYYDHFNL